MHRTCFIYKSSADKRKHICIDVDNANEILAFIKTNPKGRKKFNLITDLILAGQRASELYSKEEMNKHCKGVTAMKLFKHGANARLYCKEITNAQGVFFVVVAEYLPKKTDEGVSKKILSIIEKVGSYEYEIIDPNQGTLRKV